MFLILQVISCNILPNETAYICTFTATHLVDTKLAIEFRSIISIKIQNKYIDELFWTDIQL